MRWQGVQTHPIGEPTPGAAFQCWGLFKYMGGSVTMLEVVELVHHDFQRLGQAPKFSSCLLLCPLTPHRGSRSTVLLSSGVYSPFPNWWQGPCPSVLSTCIDGGQKRMEMGRRVRPAGWATPRQEAAGWIGGSGPQDALGHSSSWHRGIACLLCTTCHFTGLGPGAGDTGLGKGRSTRVVPTRLLSAHQSITLGQIIRLSVASVVAKAFVFIIMTVRIVIFIKQMISTTRWGFKGILDRVPALKNCHNLVVGTECEREIVLPDSKGRLLPEQTGDQC